MLGAGLHVVVASVRKAIHARVTKETTASKHERHARRIQSGSLSLASCQGDGRGGGDWAGRVAMYSCPCGNAAEFQQDPGVK